MGRGKSLKTLKKQQYEAAKAEAKGRLAGEEEAQRKKGIDVSLKEHIGKLVDNIEIEPVDTLLTLGIGYLAYEKMTSKVHIEGHWELNVPLRPGEVPKVPKTPEEYLGERHWVEAHDEVTHNWENFLMGALGYKLATSGSLPAQIAGMAVLSAIGIAATGYIGYEPPEGSLIKYANDIAKSINAALGLKV